jgi:hypothetical protein
MNMSTTATAEDLGRTRGLTGNIADKRRALASAASWGAVAPARLSLILPIPDFPPMNVCTKFRCGR